jgi:dinuclear metal center YbgI/SA1388 family protein
VATRGALVKDIMGLMEDWAPAWTAEAWDRVGLATGQPAGPAERVLVALELSDSLLAAALAQGVQMLLLHHPPIFAPLTDLRSDRPHAKRLLQAAAVDLALFSAHTNLDSAPGGVNDALAARLGLTDLAPLAPAGAGGLAKLTTFVPAEHLQAVADALFAVGAGRVGDYRECFFSSSGTGGFLAPAAGKPFLGRPGGRERVAESRLETVLPRALMARALAALQAAHPYEEPAVDVHPLDNPPPGYGLGRVGRLAVPAPGRAFLARAAAELGSVAPAASGPLPAMVERVAVVGGSGGEFMAAAAAAGAQVLVTGEARHHAAQEAADRGLCLLTLGHFETENVIVEPWAQRLARAVEEAGLTSRIDPWMEPIRPWRAAADGKED